VHVPVSVVEPQAEQDVCAYAVGWRWRSRQTHHRNPRISHFWQVPSNEANSLRFCRLGLALTYRS